MRIVGGMWRGRALKAPEGRGTRPTTDRMRERMASMVLSAFDLDLSHVVALDAFAGSGALGLELLSRGALGCTLVERDRRAASVVRDNVASLDAQTHGAVVQVGDVLSLARQGAVKGGPFSLVVLDPPYAMPAHVVSELVADLRATGLLLPGASVLYEHAGGSDELELEGASVIKHKAKGTTTLTLLRFEADEAPLGDGEAVDARRG